MTPRRVADDRTRQLWVDLGAATALLVYSAIVALPFPPPGRRGWSRYLLGMTATVLPLAGRRRWPRTAHSLVCAGAGLTETLRLAHGTQNVPVYALTLSTYSFAAYAPVQQPWIGAPMAALSRTARLLRPGPSRLMLPIFISEVGMAWYFGSLQRQRAALAAALDERALEVAHTAEDVERLAIARDRERIARDLQLVVSAAVDRMVDDARHARERLGVDRERAAALAERIAGTGRSALGTMRRLLDVLRGRGDEHLMTPAGIGAIPALLDATEHPELDVALELRGEPSSASLLTQRAVYRLVEEAVAMTRERPGQQRLAVDVDISTDGVHVRVSSSGETPGERPPVEPFDPRLTALHERVSLLGGTFRDRIAANGSFSFDAWVPASERLPERLPITAAMARAPLRSPAGGGTSVRDPLPREVVAILQRHPTWLDVAAAVGLVAASLGELLRFPEPFYDARRGPAAVLGMAATAAPLVFRRRAPISALVASAALEVVRDVLRLRWSNVSLQVMAVHIFTVASRRDPLRAALGVVIALASHAIFLARVVKTAYRTGGLGYPVAGATTLVSEIMLRIVGMWVFAALAGNALQSRDRLNGQVAARLRRVLEHRDLQAALAVADERRHLARELHDLVAHSLSAMVLQSGAAATLVHRDPEEAQRSLAVVEQLASEARDELRSLVDLLDPNALPAPTAPLAERIEKLIASARNAGVEVASEIRLGHEIDPTTSAHLHRIVQEALTNACKHAPGAPVQVQLLTGADGVVARIVNEAPVEPARTTGAVPGSGYGLVGIRERVELLGGVVTLGSRPDGGFEVRAYLPSQEWSAEDLAGDR